MSIVQYTEQEQRLTNTLRLTTEALRSVTAERDALAAERDGLKAARIAYASEFPGKEDDDGIPDVGSIHQNIRSLKAERDAQRKVLERIKAQEPAAWYDEEMDCAYTASELDGGTAHGLAPLFLAAKGFV